MVKQIQRFEKFLKVKELIPHLKEKGITFNNISEEDAEAYLTYNNNYYNLIIYKDCFEQLVDTLGNNTGMYKNLDFSYLKDLAIIDMELRIILFQMTIDIEHYLKIKILNILENIEEENGYKVVNDFLFDDFNSTKKINDSLKSIKSISNHRKVYEKYKISIDDSLIQNIPIWVFMELLSFGEFINFYKYVSCYYNLTDDISISGMTVPVVCLRNAVAHNDCVLNNIVSNDGTYISDNCVNVFLSNCRISRPVKTNKLSNERIKQFVLTIYLFDNIVTSSGLKKHVYKMLNNLFYDRMGHHANYYENNGKLLSVYNFFDLILLNIFNNYDLT